MNDIKLSSLPESKDIIFQALDLFTNLPPYDLKDILIEYNSGLDDPMQLEFYVALLRVLKIVCDEQINKNHIGIRESNEGFCMTKLKDFREQHNLTQKEIANKLDVSLSYYIKVEQGIVNAGRGFIEKFIKVFPDESADMFFGGRT